MAKLKVRGVELEPLRQRLDERRIEIAKPLADGSSFKIQVSETWRR